MRLLLDSHVLLWWYSEEPMSDGARAAISDPKNEIFASAASMWELAIKEALGRLDVPVTELVANARRDGFSELAVGFEHGTYAAGLPLHHRDPFDRILVAQAQLEGLILVTRDAAIRSYDVATLLA